MPLARIVLNLPFLAALSLAASLSARHCQAREYHVSPAGRDSNSGALDAPFAHISAAAAQAQPGDVITVHAGVYRERIDPPRGGTSAAARITYQAAPGEKVTIKGSEILKGWRRLENDAWTATLPNAFFGDYNPYRDLIHGDWFDRKGRDHHTGAVYLQGRWLTEAARLDDVLKPAGPEPLWFARVDGTNTTFWAQFKGVDPNSAEVEINVRATVFYPNRDGINFLAVRGFELRHAATQWAPPTAEQIGLIGTHWSRGWLIESNDVQYSTCVGISLGKHGDAFDNTSQDTATGYVKTIERAIAHGWSGDNIGHHIVRNNHIAHCEQAGIVGSLGAVFSVLTGNEIHDIHVRRLFGGAEMAGIKIHAAIDVEISRNHIYRCVQGIWLDWMAQGTHVARNLLHDNLWQDLFVEVDHGPFLVDHNLFLSRGSLLDQSEGGAYAHNLFAGTIKTWPEPNRETPYHRLHSTDLAGLRTIKGGDDRFFNNILVHPASLEPYGTAAQPSLMAGNVFLLGASPSRTEPEALLAPQTDPQIRLTQDGPNWSLRFILDPAWARSGQRRTVTTDSLGPAAVTGLPFVQPDNRPYRLDSDYFGRPHPSAPFPGPFEPLADPLHPFHLWPSQ